jgi:hypothetical protein
MKTDLDYQHAVILCLLAQKLLKRSQAPHAMDLHRGLDLQLWMYEPAGFTRKDYEAIGAALVPLTNVEAAL